MKTMVMWGALAALVAAALGFGGTAAAASPAEAARGGACTQAGCQLSCQQQYPDCEVYGFCKASTGTCGCLLGVCGG